MLQSWAICREEAAGELLTEADLAAVIFDPRRSVAIGARTVAIGTRTAAVDSFGSG